MKRIKQGRGVGVAVCIALAMPLAEGGTGGAAEVERFCPYDTGDPSFNTVCNVPVTANRVSANNCQIVVPVKVHVRLPVLRLNWTLSAAAGNTLLYRFRPGDGLVVDNNVDANGKALYEREAASSSETSEMHRVRDHSVRENTYSIQLQWRIDASGSWSDCDLLDPVIANEG